MICRYIKDCEENIDKENYKAFCLGGSSWCNEFQRRIDLETEKKKPRQWGK